MIMAEEHGSAVILHDAGQARVQRHGFEVQAFETAFSALMRAEGSGEAEWVRRNPHESDAVFVVDIHLAPILQRIEAALDARARLIKTYLIYKPARTGSATPWHQDLVYGDLPGGACAGRHSGLPLHRGASQPYEQA